MNTKAKILFIISMLACSAALFSLSNSERTVEIADESYNTTTTESVVTTTTTKEESWQASTTTTTVTVAQSTPPIETTTYTTVATTSIVTSGSVATTSVVSGTHNSRYYTEQDVINLAKILWIECGGVKSVTEQACVAWTVCNHVDYGYSDTISGAIKYKGHFAWRSSAPVKDNLYELAADVLERWGREKDGETDVGRVLPRGYTYFYGDGVHNYFHSGNHVLWDYSLPSPYDS